jgi:hypothetical protein
MLRFPIWTFPGISRISKMDFVHRSLSPGAAPTPQSPPRPERFRHGLITGGAVFLCRILMEKKLKQPSAARALVRENKKPNPHFWATRLGEDHFGIFFEDEVLFKHFSRIADEHKKKTSA